MKIYLFPLALLAACGGPADEPLDNQGESVEGSDQVAVPTPPVTPSPTPTAFAFAGDWAATAALCEDNGVWSFTRDQVVTDGHTACDINSIGGESTTGATLEMSCTAEGFASEQRWELSAADRGRMRVVQNENGERRPGDVVLQRCG